MEEWDKLKPILLETLKRGDLDELFELIKNKRELITEQSERLTNYLLMALSRYNAYKQHKVLGMISDENYAIQLNRLIYHLFNLMEDDEYLDTADSLYGDLGLRDTRIEKGIPLGNKRIEELLYAIIALLFIIIILILFL